MVFDHGAALRKALNTVMKNPILIVPSSSAFICNLAITFFVGLVIAAAAIYSLKLMVPAAIILIFLFLIFGWVLNITTQSAIAWGYLEREKGRKLVSSDFLEVIESPGKFMTSGVFMGFLMAILLLTIVFPYVVQWAFLYVPFLLLDYGMVDSFKKSYDIMINNIGDTVLGYVLSFGIIWLSGATFVLYPIGSAVSTVYLTQLFESLNKEE